jgi:hypothetical protein
MSFAKLAAAVLTFVLILQSGCDFWCMHAEEVASASAPQEASVPPCHGAGDSEDSQHKRHSENRGTPRDCAHPQAADNNSELKTKVVKASQAVATVEVDGARGGVQLQPLEFVVTAASNIKRNPGSPSPILRI